MKLIFTQLIERLTALILYPIVLFIIGTIIHVVNLYLLLIGQMNFTIWALWVNVFMLAFNLIMLFGLLRMKDWAIVISAIGFSLQAATWISYSIFNKQINLSTTLGIMLCLGAIPVLVFIYRRQKSIKESQG